ncbi:hypothetical protein BC831DRAFT_455690 [Entophlyctis helioformis]|nr:hypothetical protein BC831DRAFT_455690 [Entophlyctis helioformis]
MFAAARSRLPASTATRVAALAPCSAAAQLAFRRNVQVAINQVRRGQVLNMRSKLWVVTSWSHHKQGRGGAHYKLELRELLDGTKAFERMNTGTAVDVVDLEQKTYQFMYADERMVHLIDQDTFEEHEYPIGIIAAGEKALPFLQDTMIVKVEYHNESPVLIKIPEKATYTVADTAPVAHNASESSKGTVYKTATLENGAQVSVPEFVNIGDQVVVDLMEQKYLSRARDT